MKKCYHILEKLPEIKSELICRKNSLNLKTVPDGTIIGLDNYKEERNSDEPPFEGHDASSCVILIQDTPHGRRLCFWRRQIFDLVSETERQESQGQGLSVDLNFFLEHQDNPRAKKGRGLEGKIAPPKEEKEYFFPVTRIFTAN